MIGIDVCREMLWKKRSIINRACLRHKHLCAVIILSYTDGISAAFISYVGLARGWRYAANFLSNRSLYLTASFARNSLSLLPEGSFLS